MEKTINKSDLLSTIFLTSWNLVEIIVTHRVFSLSRKADVELAISKLARCSNFTHLKT
jgi:hypothetical protein